MEGTNCDSLGVQAEGQIVRTNGSSVLASHCEQLPSLLCHCFLAPFGMEVVISESLFLHYQTCGYTEALFIWYLGFQVQPQLTVKQ